MNNNNVNKDSDSNIEHPNEDVHNDTNNNPSNAIDKPKTVSNPFSKYIRKDPSQEKARLPEDDEDC